MAKKTVKEVEAPAPEQPTQETPLHEMISFESLMLGRVHVQDRTGNKYYLDPSRKQGEFILRVVPNPVPESASPIPAEWVKPTEEELKAANKAIDWGLAEEPETTEEGGENV